MLVACNAAAKYMRQLAVRLDLALGLARAGCLPASKRTKSVGELLLKATQEADYIIVVKLQCENSSSCAPPVPCHQ